MFFPSGNKPDLMTMLIFYYLLCFGCFLLVAQVTLTQLGLEQLLQEWLSHSFLEMNVSQD